MNNNFLLGKGENLSKPVIRKTGFSKGKPPYSFAEAQERLIVSVEETVRAVMALPDAACPNEEAVAAIVLHPQYLSKSSYPADFLRETGLHAVGSRPVTVQPDKWGKKGDPVLSPSSEIFVAGQKDAFENLAARIGSWTEESNGGEEIIRIENFRIVPVEERVKPIRTERRDLMLEVALHAGEDAARRYIIEGFQEYLRSLDILVDLDNRIDVRELTFLPVRAARDAVDEVAKFSFLRLAREMPALRMFHPSMTMRVPALAFPVMLPDSLAHDSTIRAAIFDGGMPDMPALTRWVTATDAPGVGESHPDLLNHGLQVTSAFLFGSLEEGITAPIPFANVEHFRVCDNDTVDDMQGNSYKVLQRIVSVLEKQKFDFINLSIGPDQPIEDDDINPWTAKLDALLADGQTLMTVAVGNSGEDDDELGYNRIQPPSDCVNALGVGACDSQTFMWAKALYSSVGCGRSPGIVKPDGLAFGGSEREPFYALSTLNPALAVRTWGTSVASPTMMRACAGVKAVLGDHIAPLAIRGLMVHSCDLNGNDWQHVGWGRFDTTVENLISCESGMAHIIYQDILDPKKVKRVDIPVPDTTMPGYVYLSATLCFTSETDPQDPMHYTRSGLSVFFLPDKLDTNDSGNPKVKPFFKSRAGLPELQLRNNEHKWETTLRVAHRKFLGKTLVNPALDVHYSPRFAGHDVTHAPPLPYTLIVTVHAPRVPDLYDRIWGKYKHQLTQMVPRIEPRIRL